jgi:hypothetical protein
MKSACDMNLQQVTFESDAQVVVEVIHTNHVGESVFSTLISSKVLAFAWKLLRNRIPTRANLAYRGIAVNGGVVTCVQCQGMEETVTHLFLFCDFADKVWKAISGGLA